MCLKIDVETSTPEIEAPDLPRKTGLELFKARRVVALLVVVSEILDLSMMFNEDVVPV